MSFELIILTIFIFVVLVMVIGFGCLIRYRKVVPSDAGVVHGFVGGRSLGGGFGHSGGGGDGGGGCWWD